MGSFASRTNLPNKPDILGATRVWGSSGTRWRLWFTSPKSNSPPCLLRRLHQLADGVEDGAELGVVLLFQLRQLAGKVGVLLKHLTEAHERAHDFDVHLHRARAAQHARQHGHALLGEGVGQILAVPSATRFVVLSLIHI